MCDIGGASKCEPVKGELQEQWGFFFKKSSEEGDVVDYYYYYYYYYLFIYLFIRNVFRRRLNRG